MEGQQQRLQLFRRNEWVPVGLRRRRLDKSKTPKEAEALEIAREGLRIAMATNDMVEQSMRAQAEAKETAERTEESARRLEQGQSAMSTVLKRVNVGVRGLVTTTDKILGITQRTEQHLKTLRNRGRTAFVYDLVFDEWIMLYLYLLLHPLAPLTTEGVMAWWQFALTIRRGSSLYREFRESRLIQMSVSGVMYTYFTSPWKAIYLIYWYNKRFLSLRGTTDYTTYFPGALDPLFGSMSSVFFGFLSELRTMNVASLANTASQGGHMAKEAIVTGVQAFFAKAPEAFQAIQETCPMFGTDPTTFANCLADFVAGKLYIVIDGVSHFLAAPGYLFELGEYVEMETQVVFWIGSLVWKFVNVVFKTLLKNLDVLAESFLCKIGGTWGIPNLGKLLGYACKVKTDGGGDTDVVDSLDYVLAYSSLSLCMASSVEPLTHGNLVVDRAYLREYETLVDTLIRIESSNQFVGDDVLSFAHSTTQTNVRTLMDVDSHSLDGIEPNVRIHTKRNRTRRRRRVYRKQA